MEDKYYRDLTKKSLTVFVTYANETQTAFAILSLNNFLIGGNILKTKYGKTKLCYYFMKNSPCKN